MLYGIVFVCCNLSLHLILDKEVFSYITDPEKVKILHKLILTTNNEEILLSCCTLIYQLLASENNRRFLPGEVLKRIQQITNSNKTNKRLGNITSLLLLDFGRRYELLKGPSK